MESPQKAKQLVMIGWQAVQDLATSFEMMGGCWEGYAPVTACMAGSAHLS